MHWHANHSKHKDDKVVLRLEGTLARASRMGKYRHQDHDAPRRRVTVPDRENMQSKAEWKATGGALCIAA